MGGNEVPAHPVATPDALVDEARTRSGLSDFGADGWQEGVAQLLAAAEADLAGDPSAIERLEGSLVNRLVTRLHVESWYAAHGDEAGDAVQGPVVIVGLPRTATTALNHLLAVDPQFRITRQWEMSSPLPPPDAATEHDDPRRPTDTGFRGDVRHIAAADGPTEDNPLWGLDFHAQELGFPLPTYTTWWRTADLGSCFAYHERMLRLLHSHRPPHRWLLKAPAYLFHLDAFAAQYPEARFLVTHRDPVAAIPSACSTIAASRPMLVPGWEPPPSFGAFVLEHYVIGVQRMMAARDRLGEERFLDVGQRQVELDAVGTAARIHEFLGLELSDDVRRAMVEWAAVNQRGSRGEHRYSSEEYGLTDDGIRAAFAPYTDRFGAFAA
jgi:Sulfotransferase family